MSTSEVVVAVPVVRKTKALRTEEEKKARSAAYYRANKEKIIAQVRQYQKAKRDEQQRLLEEAKAAGDVVVLAEAKAAEEAAKQKFASQYKRRSLPYKVEKILKDKELCAVLRERLKLDEHNKE